MCKVAFFLIFGILFLPVERLKPVESRQLLFLLTWNWVQSALRAWRKLVWSGHRRVADVWAATSHLVLCSGGIDGIIQFAKWSAILEHKIMSFTTLFCRKSKVSSAYKLILWLILFEMYRSLWYGGSDRRLLLRVECIHGCNFGLKCGDRIDCWGSLTENNWLNIQYFYILWDYSAKKKKGFFISGIGKFGPKICMGKSCNTLYY